MAPLGGGRGAGRVAGRVENYRGGRDAGTLCGPRGKFIGVGKSHTLGVQNVVVLQLTGQGDRAGDGALRGVALRWCGHPAIRCRHEAGEVAWTDSHPVRTYDAASAEERHAAGSPRDELLRRVFLQHWSLAAAAPPLRFLAQSPADPPRSPFMQKDVTLQPAAEFLVAALPFSASTDGGWSCTALPRRRHPPVAPHSRREGRGGLVVSTEEVAWAIFPAHGAGFRSPCESVQLYRAPHGHDGVATKAGRETTAARAPDN